MFDLPHVASRLYGTPLLVSRPHLESVLSLVENRMFHGEPLASAEGRDSRSADLRITSDGIAVIPVIGTLVRRATGMSAACGMPSYHGIAEMAEEAFTSPEVKGVLLEIDSGGGEAAGVFDLAESLRRMSRETEKPLWAVADETALSAAYAIACSAERILLPRTAEVGSIGVFGVHVDVSAADQQQGHRYTYIYAGAHKIDGNPHEPLSESVYDSLQADVDSLYELFVESVAKQRKCSVESIRSTEARSYRGEAALSVGLADALGTFEQAYSALVQHCNTSSNTPRKIHVLSGTSTQEMSAMKEKGNVDTEIQRTPPKAEDVRDAIGMEMKNRLETLADIAEQAKRLGITVDPMKALLEDVTPEALTSQVLKQAAELDAAAEVFSAHGVAPSVPEGQSDSAGRLASAVNNLCGGL